MRSSQGLPTGGHFASPAGPPPPGRFQPPPPPVQNSRSQGSENDNEYDDDDSGPLGATINLVSSAANMFFKAAAPLPPPQVPSNNNASAPPPRGPPPPIDPGSSMLDQGTGPNGRGLAGFRQPSGRRLVTGSPAVPSSPLARSSPRVVLSQGSPLQAPITPQIHVTPLSGATPKTTTSKRQPSPQMASKSTAPPPPAMPSLPAAVRDPPPAAWNAFNAPAPLPNETIPIPIPAEKVTSGVSLAESIFESIGPAQNGPNPTSSTPSASSPIPTKKEKISEPSLGEKEVTKSMPPLLSRATPPPSPSQNRASVLPEEASMATPVRSNSHTKLSSLHFQSTTASPSMDPSTPARNDTSVTGSTPLASSVRRSLPTPGSRSRLRAPPPPRSGGSATGFGTPSRAKFKLPPPRKPRTSKASTPAKSEAQSLVSSEETPRHQESATRDNIETSNQAPEETKPLTTTAPEESVNPSKATEASKDLLEHISFHGANDSTVPPTPAPTPAVATETVVQSTLTMTSSVHALSVPTLREPKGPKESSEVSKMAIAEEVVTKDTTMVLQVRSDDEAGLPPELTPPPEDSHLESNVKSEQDTLPPGWIEQREPSSGKLYYCNLSTNKTSWDRPKPETAGDYDNADKPNEGKTSNINVGESTPIEEERIIESGITPEKTEEPLPSEWVEQMDPSSGNIYYRNTATNGTSWERPLSTMEVDQPSKPIEEMLEANSTLEQMPSEAEQEPNPTEAQPDATNPDAKDEAMPSGWLEQTDPSTDEVYYYNPLTNETSWERPSAAVEKKDESKPNEDNPVADNSNEGQHNQVAVEGTKPLPIGWMEANDPTNGGVYYYNTDTGETSWERPSIEKPPSTLEVLKEQITRKDSIALEDAFPEDQVESHATEPEIEHEPSYDEVEVDDAAAVPEQATENNVETYAQSFDAEVEGDLPAGWNAATDPNSGRVFYYNAAGETSWDRPTLPEPSSTFELPQDQQESIQTESGGLSEPEVEHEPSNDEVEADDAAAVPEQATENIVETYAESFDAEVEGDLPAGWNAATDPNSGRVFYYNAAGETSWDRPTVSEPSSTFELLQDQQESKQTECLGVTGDHPPEVTMNQLPDVAATEGQVANQNCKAEDEMVPSEAPLVTEETDIPESSLVQVSPTKSNEETAITAEPGVGQETTDVTDVQAKDSVLDNPDDGGIPTPKEFQVAKNPSGNVESGYRALDEVNDGRSIKLPLGWAATSDPTSGKVFYFNESTGESSWDPPRVAIPPSTLEYLKEQQIAEPTLAIDVEVDLDLAESDDDAEYTADPDSQKQYQKMQSSTECHPPQHEMGNALFDEFHPDNTTNDSSSRSTTEPRTENPQANVDLLEGWQQLTEPDTGRIYYFNALTGKTAWEPPSLTVQPTIQESSEQSVKEQIDREAMMGRMPGQKNDETSIAPCDTPEIDQKDRNVGSTCNEEYDGDGQPAPHPFPIGWEEVTDPATGMTYFYNPESGATSWERPEGLPSEPPSTLDYLKEQQQQQVEDIFAAMNAEFGIEENIEDEKGPPSGGTSRHAESETSQSEKEVSAAKWERGYNTVDEVRLTDAAPEVETDLLASEHDDFAAAVGEEDGNKVPLDVLPVASDWVEIVDPASGNTYYYNSTSGETSWTHPAAPSLQSPNADGPLLDAAADLDETGYRLNENAVAPNLDPHENYNDRGEASSSSCSENQESNNSSSAPEVSEAESVGQEDDPASNLIDSEYEWPSSPEYEPEELQPSPDETSRSEDFRDQNDGGNLGDWTAVTDSNGNTYYYNTETHETTWDKPTATSSPEAPEDDFPSEIDGTAPPNVNDKVSGDMENEHPFAQLEGPDVAVQQELVGEKSSDGCGQPGEDLSVASQELTLNWMKVSDPSTGAVYFYNIETQETSWDPPAIDAIHYDDETKLSAEPATTEFTEDAHRHDSSVDTKQEEALLDGWAEMEEPDAGIVYNEVNGETSWGKPAAGASEPRLQEQQGLVGDEVQKTSSIADDWRQVSDPSTGRNYYFNTISGETSWDLPNKLSDGDRGDNEIHFRPAMEDKAMEVGYSGDSTAEDDDLPPGWSVTLDPGTQQTCYFNEATEETVSEKPSVEGPNTTRPESSQTRSETAPITVVSNPMDSVYTGEEPETMLPLLEGWEEIEDPSSGETYYYHTETMRTSWERPVRNSSTPRDPPDLTPPELEKPEMHEDVAASVEHDGDLDNRALAEVSSHANESSAALRNSSSGDAVDNEFEETGKSANTYERYDLLPELDDKLDDTLEYVLPEFWTQAVDEDSGRVYYFHTLSQETSWDPPEGSLPVAENHSENPASEHEPQEDIIHTIPPDDSGDVSETIHFVSTLPENKVDGVYDPVENSLAETATEREILRLESPEIRDADEKSAMGGYTEPVSLPHRSKATEDPQTGQTYYFNEASGEKAWSLDGISPSGAKTSEKEPEADASLCEPPLPDGWIASEDLSTGRRYYVNKATSERSWGIPETAITGDSANDHGGDLAQDQTHESLHGDIGVDSNLPPGWSVAEDTETGRKFYTNEATGESSWELPALNVADSAPPSTGIAIDEDIGGNACEKPAEEGYRDRLDNARHDSAESNLMLPNGWSTGVHPDTGEVYFYNEITGETSWDQPSNPDDRTVESFPGEEEVDQTDAQEVDDVVGKDAAKLKNLPAGWEEVVDESSGETYYFNEATGETSWDPPVATEEPGDVVENDPVGGISSANERSLRHGWVEAVDPDSGEIYYVNEIDGQTSWEKPKEIEGAVVLDETEFSDTPSLTDRLPEGWVEVIDPQTGDAYYFNETTNETSWERPETKKEPTCENSNNVEDSWVDVGEEYVSSGLGTNDFRSAESMKSGNFRGKLVSRLASSLDLENIETTWGNSSQILLLDESRLQDKINGPLIEAQSSDVQAYIYRKAEDGNRDLLWKLIEVAAKAKGRLRSDDGISSPNSPESMIVKILLSNDSTDSSNTLLKPTGDFVIRENGVPDQEKDSAKVRVESLLLQGKRVEAVEEAIACRDFATALLVGSMCDAETYKRATIAYTQNAFDSASPLNTVAMLFTGSLSAGSEFGTSDHWGVAPSELKVSWKKHLAGIISNRIAGWDSIVLSLADRLRDIGEIPGSHFCYMVCGCPIASAVEENTRICLLGADHSKLSERGLLTAAGIDAFDRTEAYEWAKRQGNPNALLKSFQPFKLVFIAHLVDSGLDERARSYVRSIQHHLGFSSLRSEATPSLDNLHRESSAQAEALKLLESHLGCPHISPPRAKESVYPSYASSPFDGPLPAQFKAEESDPVANLDVTFQSAKSNLMDVTGYTMSPEKPEPKTLSPAGSHVVEASGSFRKSESIDNEVKQSRLQDESRPASSENVPESPPSSPRKTDSPQQQPPFMAVPSQNFPQAPVVAGKPQMVPMAPGSTTKTPGTSTLESVPASTAIPRTAPQPEKQGKSGREPVATPQGRNHQLKPAPSTAPSVMIGNKDRKVDRGKALPSSGKGGLSFRQRLVKLFNPDATEVSLPENEEKPYYDEKRKVWVFPGDNPDDLVKPIAPPPTMTAKSQAESEKPVPAEVSNDPLAAMMAPPSRAPSSLRRAGVGSRPGFPPSMGMPGMPPGTAGTAPPTAPPQFAVFQPKPKDKSQRKN